MIRLVAFFLMAACAPVFAHEEHRSGSLFTGKQTYLPVTGELDRYQPSELGVVVHLKNVSERAICIPTAFLPRDGAIREGIASVLTEGNAPAEFIGVRGYSSPPYQVFDVVPAHFSLDVYYNLGRAFRLSKGQGYKMRVRVDGFYCSALDRGYVFPQSRSAKDWTDEFGVPAVDLEPSEMLTFTLDSFEFVAR